MIIGIDPGVSGAIAILDDGCFRAVHDMPYHAVQTASGRAIRRIDPDGLAALLHAACPLGYYSPPEVYIERQMWMPDQHAGATFATGEGQGIIRGISAAVGWDVALITPQHWKQAAGLIGAAKSDSVAKALSLYPSAGEYLTKAKHHGRAEAILIAHYGHLLTLEAAA